MTERQNKNGLTVGEFSAMSTQSSGTDRVSLEGVLMDVSGKLPESSRTKDAWILTTEGDELVWEIPNRNVSVKSVTPPGPAYEGSIEFLLQDTEDVLECVSDSAPPEFAEKVKERYSGGMSGEQIKKLLIDSEYAEDVLERSAEKREIPDSLIQKPFADYEDFDACVRDNSDKNDPEAYCAQIHYDATGRWPGEKESKTDVQVFDFGKDEDDKWVPYVGPEGGEGWQRVSDGNVRYGTDPPTSGETVDPMAALNEVLGLDESQMRYLDDKIGRLFVNDDLDYDDKDELERHIAATLIRADDVTAFDADDAVNAQIGAIVDEATEQFIDMNDSEVTWGDAQSMVEENTPDWFSVELPEEDVIEDQLEYEDIILAANEVSMDMSNLSNKVAVEAESRDTIDEDDPMDVIALTLQMASESSDINENHVAEFVKNLDDDVHTPMESYTDARELSEMDAEERISNAFENGKMRIDARDYGISGGNTTGGEMEVIEYDDGQIDFAIPARAYKSTTTAVVDDMDTAIDRNLGSPKVIEALNGNTCKTELVQSPEGESYIVKEGIDGMEANEYKMQEGSIRKNPILEESTIQTLASAFFVGNTDLHGGNLFVGEDMETMHIIDHDSGGSGWGGEWPDVSTVARRFLDLEDEIQERVWDMADRIRNGDLEIPPDVNDEVSGYVERAVDEALQDATDAGYFDAGQVQSNIPADVPNESPFSGFDDIRERQRVEVKNPHFDEMRVGDVEDVFSDAVYVRDDSGYLHEIKNIDRVFHPQDIETGNAVQFEDANVGELQGHVISHDPDRDTVFLNVDGRGKFEVDVDELDYVAEGEARNAFEEGMYVDVPHPDESGDAMGQIVNVMDGQAEIEYEFDPDRTATVPFGQMEVRG